MIFFHQAIEKSSTLIQLACPWIFFFLTDRCSLYGVQILPFTLEILASMVGTIYVSMVLHSYILSVLFSILQVLYLLINHDVPPSLFFLREKAR